MLLILCLWFGKRIHYVFEVFLGSRRSLRLGCEFCMDRAVQTLLLRDGLMLLLYFVKTS